MSTVSKKKTKITKQSKIQRHEKLPHPQHTKVFCCNTSTQNKSCQVKLRCSRIRSRWSDRRNLTSLSRCTAFMLSPTLMHWRYIIKLQHGNHKLPSASIEKKNWKNKGGIKKMKYRVRRWQCRNPQGLLTNVWPQTCGVERRRGMGKIWGYWKEKHSVAGETQSNSSKSPGSQSLYRLLPYWLLHWFKSTCNCVMKHHCK